MTQQYLVPESRFGTMYREILPHDFNPAVSDIEARALLQERLEVEGRVKYDEFMLSALEEENPGDAEALKEWLEEEETKLKELAAAGVIELDDAALVEAELLDDIIAELHKDNAPTGLIKLAEVRKDLKLARRELRAFKKKYPQAA